MLRADLKLNEALEEDISDCSPYLGTSLIPASSSSSSTDTTSLPTPRYAQPPLPLRFIAPQSFSVPHIPQGVARKKSLGELNSPASPTLGKRPGVGPPPLSRSQTLPTAFLFESKPGRRQSELDKISVAQDLIENLRRWIIGIAIVDFDLDDGPVIEGIYPPSPLLPAEAENIAFSAFPDSLQFDQGSASHSFRVRKQVNPVHAEKTPQINDGFIYGYSYFMQQRDTNSKRGYEQNSIVILTHLQFPAFFSSLIHIFGPLYQKHGLPMIETACHNVATWCEPTPGVIVELGFLGVVLRLELPYTVDEQQFTETSRSVEKYDPERHILASSAPLLPPPLLLFEAALPQLWTIWECLVLCEPLLVFGMSPTQTSQAIWWLRDLLRPIPLAGDFRPYFTMQDGDNALLVNKLPPKSGVILGVTNPFFEKSCGHWPHILSLGRRRTANTATKLLSGSSPAGPAPGWKSKTHKRYISKDRTLLKQLETALNADERTKLNASLTLRRHFCSRTTGLLAPLARYLNTLIPSPTEVDTARPSGLGLRLKPFNSADFFISLKASGSTLPFRSTGKRTEFYERWLKTPAFGLWLAQQEHIVESVLKDK